MPHLLIPKIPFSSKVLGSQHTLHPTFLGEFAQFRQTVDAFMNSVKCSSDAETLAKSADQSQDQNPNLNQD
jgi:hypothetical protein